MNIFRAYRPWVWLTVAAIAALIVLLVVVRPWREDAATTEQAAPVQVQPNEVAMSADTARDSGIAIETAGPAAIGETVTLYGTIKPNAEREQELRARYPGVVRLVNKRPGETVARGETLVTVESNESLQTYGIASPIAGSVLERHANPGESVGSDTVLMKVADLGTVWAEFAVFAHDLGRVRPGLNVRVSGSDTGQVAHSTIAYVAPAGSADSQTVAARAVLDNADGRWVARQFATADVVLSEVQASVAVNPAALQNVHGKVVVFVRTAQGFQARGVTIGKRSGDAVEVTQGLRAGERYASANSYIIKADLLKGEAEEE
ncbi:MAG: efflux RND transporter periplasmic adaptor subunit [Rhizomicrobium sp.]